MSPGIAGRAVVIGDAAQSRPPTIAQGAAQGLEDALVLTELLIADGDAVDQALWDGVPRQAPAARAVPWSRRRCSWANGSSRETGTPTPPA